MEGAYDRLVEKVQTLSDLELAVLVCLVAEQHCIIKTEGQLLDNVQEELKLVSRIHLLLFEKLTRPGRYQRVWPHVGGAGVQRANHTR